MHRSALFALCLGIVIAAGCGSTQPTHHSNTTKSARSTTATASTQSAPGAPQKGGTIIAAIGGDPPGINPDVSTGVPNALLGCNFYPGLIRVSNKGTIEPMLANSWQVSSNGLKYTFHLVDAKWQDGKPFTSADVKFTLENVSAKYGPRFQTAAKDLASIQTPDAHTVVINLKQPFGPMLLDMDCANNTGILPEHVFQNTNILQNAASLNKPVSVGPFVLQQWVRGDHITLARNPNYWKKGRPYVDRLIFKEIPDASSRVLALKSGSINDIFYYYLQQNQLSVLARSPQIHLYPNRSFPGDELIILNDRKPPLNNRLVRQALFMAINRTYIVKSIFSGHGQPGRSSIDTRIAWAYNPAVNYQTMYPYDPAKAKALLNKAGYKVGPNGTRFTIHLVYDSTRAGYNEYAQAVQQFWKAVGVNVVLNGSERQVELQQVYKDWSFGATLQEYTTSGDPALGISRLYVTSAIKKQPFVNASGYSNPKVDALFREGALAASRAKRAVYYRQVQTILAKDVPTLVVAQASLSGAARSTVHNGPWMGMEGYGWWDGAWVSK